MTYDTDHDLVEIGIVSTDTRGVFVGEIDEEGGLQLKAGLSDD